MTCLFFQESFLSLIKFVFDRFDFGLDKRNYTDLQTDTHLLISSHLIIYLEVWIEIIKNNPTIFSGEHGDDAPFDGFGGVLGHTFPPNDNNRALIHLDLDETWNFEWMRKRGKFILRKNIMKLIYNGHVTLKLVKLLTWPLATEQWALQPYSLPLNWFNYMFLKWIFHLI